MSSKLKTKFFSAIGETKMTIQKFLSQPAHVDARASTASPSATTMGKFWCFSRVLPAFGTHFKSPSLPTNPLVILGSVSVTS